MSPSDREDDAALDDLLQPWSYGATPFLTPAMQRSFSGGGGGAAEPTILEEDAEAEPAAPHPSIFTEQLRPTLLHRPSSLLSRRSIASSITSSTRDRVNEPPRPYNLPPGLAASSPIPPSSSASTLRPPLSTNDSSATAVRKRRSWLGGFVAPSAATTAASQALASAATAQPRGARVQYEPPIPLEVQLLLLTTPPPPRKRRPSTAVLVQERAEFLQGEAAVKRAAKAKVEREAVAREKEKNEKEGKEGLVRRLWSSRLSGIYGGGKRGDTTETEAEMETEDEYVKVQGPSALELGGRRWSQQKGSPGGKIDSKSHKEVVPKTWDEYSRFYAAVRLPSPLSTARLTSLQLSAGPARHRRSSFPTPLIVRRQLPLQPTFRSPPPFALRSRPLLRPSPPLARHSHPGRPHRSSRPSRRAIRPSTGTDWSSATCTAVATPQHHHCRLACTVNSVRVVGGEHRRTSRLSSPVHLPLYFRSRPPRLGRFDSTFVHRLARYRRQAPSDLRHFPLTNDNNPSLLPLSLARPRRDAAIPQRKRSRSRSLLVEPQEPLSPRQPPPPSAQRPSRVAGALQPRSQSRRDHSLPLDRCRTLPYHPRIFKYPLTRRLSAALARPRCARDLERREGTDYSRYGEGLAVERE